MTQAFADCRDQESRSDRANVAGDEGGRYRFDRLALTTVMKDLRFERADPGPGDRIPPFDLGTLDGGHFRSSDLAATGPTLMIFGSSTCPMTDSAAPGLQELHRRYGGGVRFVLVNVREAHPGQSYPQPKSVIRKLEHANRLRALHDFEFEVAVDDVDGSLHRAMGPKPNSAYVIGPDGTILFRAQWADDTAALAEALDAVTSGRAPRRSQSGGILVPMLRTLRFIAPVLDRAGRGAWPDMWRVAPPLAAIALVFKILGLGPRRA